ncbi:MAG: FMN-binding protein [Candidatus Margulisbacteria bacterium]|nr:FMN-binding protein [Candidatus Margulisiibacteriota bacterium]MBU1616810.1 FMN-binding protein [Candidatus Margulisiibacteriota bacterium]
MLKKIGKILGIILLVIVCVVGVFFVRFTMMAKNVASQYRQITTVNLAQLADGKYSGSFGDFLVYVKVEVTVNKHAIREIKVVDQRCGPGYEALETVDRIIKAQSPKVDAVTGASGSSMSIMIAVNRALTGQK